MTKLKTPAVPVAPAVGDRLQLMETFVRIVEAGSLSAAAAQLNATQPTVSRRLQTLEQSLGVRLLHRSTHAMRLTADGQRCFERAKELLANWASFEADVRGAQEEPEGTLRIAAPHAFGQEQFVVPLAAFLKRYPRVSVEWVLRDDVRDFIATGIDCAIHAGEPADPSVVAIKIAEVPRIAVASPALFDGRAVPTHPDGLANLPWLALNTYYRNEVKLTHAKSGELARFPIRPRIATDNLYALRSAVRLGLGAGIGSAWMLEDDIASGTLIHLTPSWRAAPLPLFMVYPHAQFYPSRLVRFVETMRAAVPAIVER